VELAAKYGYTDDGQSITDEQAGFEEEEMDGAIVSYETTRKQEKAPPRKPVSQQFSKVDQKNHLSSIEVDQMQ
jgi:hypothetical protein